MILVRSRSFSYRRLGGRPDLVLVLAPVPPPLVLSPSTWPILSKSSPNPPWAVGVSDLPKERAATGGLSEKVLMAEAGLLMVEDRASRKSRLLLAMATSFQASLDRRPWAELGRLGISWTVLALDGRDRVCARP